MSDANITAIAQEHAVDRDRTTPANACAAFSQLVTPELGGVELRRLTNAFGRDPQWVASASLPTADLVAGVPDLVELLAGLARQLDQLMGWASIIVTLGWQPQSANAARASLTLTYRRE